MHFGELMQMPGPETHSPPPVARQRRSTGAIVAAALLGLLAVAQLGGLILLLADEGATNSRFVRQERAERNAPFKWIMGLGAVLCVGGAALCLRRR